MGLLPHKLSIAILLAVYSAISLLGHGLHSLAPHAGHHHGMKVVQCATHDGKHVCDCVFHRRAAELDRVGSSECAEASWTASACAGCSHDCQICHFLAQARSVQPQLTGALIWQPLVTDIRPAGDALWFESITLGSHVPRGPPLRLA